MKNPLSQIILFAVIMCLIQLLAVVGLYVWRDRLDSI